MFRALRFSLGVQGQWGDVLSVEALEWIWGFVKLYTGVGGTLCLGLTNEKGVCLQRTNPMLFLIHDRPHDAPMSS